MIIKNNTGGVDSINEVGAIDIVDGGTFDLTGTDADTGRPTNLSAEVASAGELLAKVEAAEWAVLDEGGAPLSAAEGVSAITSASVRDVKTDNGERINDVTTLEAVPNSTWTDVISWTLEEGEWLTYVAELSISFGDASDVVVETIHAIGHGVRRTGQSAQVFDSGDSGGSGGVPQLRIQNASSGNDVALQVRGRFMGNDVEVCRDINVKRGVKV